MREYAIATRAGGASRQRDAKRFKPLMRLGYSISGCDGDGFTATNLASGKEIRRLTFDAFAKAVRKEGMTRTARSELLEKRASPDGRLREQVECQRLQLLAMESRELRNG